MIFLNLLYIRRYKKYQKQIFEYPKFILDKNLKLEVEFNSFTDNLKFIFFVYRDKIIFSINPFFNSKHFYLTVNHNLLVLAGILLYGFDFLNLKRIEFSEKKLF